MEPNSWVFMSNITQKTVYYSIGKVYDPQTVRVIFAVQLPLVSLQKKYKWSDIVDETIRSDIEDLIEILPKYMQDICLEHNFVKRVTEFPDYRIGHLDYTSSCISIGGDGKRLQIAGCHPDDVGEDFVKYFVKGLRGEWKGIHFAGCDNPCYEGDD